LATGRAGVFISYRREESAPQAGRLYDNLSARFGEDRVFMDIDSIGLGLDFTEVIQDAVSSCQVLLAMIGSEWLSIVDERGNRRIDDPKDYVRLEIQAALDRGIRVVPVLINGAPLPSPDLLPPDLRSMARRQALALDDVTFRSNVGRLIDQLEHVIPAVRPPSEPERRAPDAALTPWSVELVDRGINRRTLSVTLGQERHEIRIKRFPVGLGYSVVMDGEKVSRAVGYINSVHQFAITDGERRYPARVEAGQGLWEEELKVRSVEIDGRVLYRE
jgi:TIR domain